MLGYIRSIRAYEIVAFVTGFALLAYELAAARILAPSIGSSTYIWTSVIGVIIAALSAGYAVGGVVADKRVAPQDIAWLLLASAVGVSMTLVFADGTLAMLQGIRDARLKGLLASLFLFMPASFVLGTISPYLARLRTSSLTTTGRSVASLSAMNAIGGIVGTFCVGFIFFGFIGAKETLIFVILLLLAASWLVVPKHRLMQRGVVSIIVAIASLLQLAPPAHAGVVADINTPSARYRVIEGSYLGAPVRILSTGPRGSQSGVYTNGSNELVFDYTRQMASIVEQAPKKDSILILGGGAFTLPAYLADRHNGPQIDVVEIDPGLVDISKKYFNYRDRPNIRIYTQDARAFINSNHKQYDIILVDVYTDTSIPFAVTTLEYAERLKQSLANDGIVVVNAIGSGQGACGRLLRSVHHSYATHFANYKLQPQRDPAMESLQNIVMTYADTSLEWLEAPSTRLDGDRQTLTDNFAPLERMQQTCWDQRT